MWTYCMVCRIIDRAINVVLLAAILAVLFGR